MLYEVETIFRQVFTRWTEAVGGSFARMVGVFGGQKWEGDTLVVDTRGFNDKSWLDARGHGHSEGMRVEERFQRRDFGHMEVAVTIEDPKTFTKPVHDSLHRATSSGHGCDRAHVARKTKKDLPRTLLTWPGNRKIHKQ